MRRRQMKKILFLCLGLLAIIIFTQPVSAVPVQYELSGIILLEDLDPYAQQQFLLCSFMGSAIVDNENISNDSLWSDYVVDEYEISFLDITIAGDGLLSFSDFDGFLYLSNFYDIISTNVSNGVWSVGQELLPHIYLPGTSAYGMMPIIHNTNTGFDMMSLQEISFDQAAPVPEPLTIALFGSGLVCLFGFRKNKNEE